MNKKLLYTYAIIFLVMSLFFGKVLDFYKTVPSWDKILHTFSGFVLYPWGLYLYSRLKGDKNNTKLKIIFGLLFSFSSALLWEVWEFRGDRLFNLNSQNNSLSDTMWDMILGCLGAVLSAIIHKDVKNSRT